MKKILGLTSIMLASGIAVFASPVTPTYDTFGTLSGATFGGTGIPNTAVAITTINNPYIGATITLGLSATPRYSAPGVGNDGAGTFYATPGTANGKCLWNFDYYISVNNSAIQNYTFKLLYGTDALTLATMAPDPVSVAFNDGGKAYTTVAGTTIAQDSEPLSYSFLGTPIGFDPNASGIYSFELQAFNSNGYKLGETAINVQVGTVPDAASTAMLLGLGLVGLAVFSVRQNRQAMAK